MPAAARQVDGNLQWGVALGAWEQSPHCQRHGDLGAAPPAFENFAFFR